MILTGSLVMLGCQAVGARFLHDYKGNNSRCHNHLYLGTREAVPDIYRTGDILKIADLPLTLVADTLMLPWDLGVAVVEPYGDCHVKTGEWVQRAPAPRVVEHVRVVVLNPEFQVLRTIDDATALAEFTRLWQARERVDPAPLDLSEYDVALDIMVNRRSGRWIYRTDGLTALLSAKSGNVYRVPDASSLNALLHLEAKPRAFPSP
jgi:uncharacterized protein YceK